MPLARARTRLSHRRQLKPLLRASYFFLDGFEVGLETPLIYSLCRIHKPERATCRGKVLDDFRSDRHLNSLNSLEEQSLQVPKQ